MRMIKAGLALGACTTRGKAHIKVSNALQRTGIIIDSVAVGSNRLLVSAAYACGRLPLRVCRRALFGQYGGLLQGERKSTHSRQLLLLADFTYCETQQYHAYWMQQGLLPIHLPAVFLVHINRKRGVHYADAAIGAGKLASENKMDEQLPLVRTAT